MEEDTIFKNVQSIKQKLEKTKRSLQDLHLSDRSNDFGGSNSSNSVRQAPDGHHLAINDTSSNSQSSKRTSYELERAKKHLERIQSENDRLVEQNHKLMLQLEDTTDRVCQIKADKVVLTKEMEQLSLRLKKENEVYEEKTECLERSEKELILAQNSLKEAEEDMIRLRYELAEQKRCNQQMAAEREGAIIKVKEFESTFTGIKKEKDDTIEKLMESKRKLQTKYESTLVAKSGLEQTNCRLKDELDDYKDRFSSLVNKLEETEEQKGKFEVQLIEVNDLLNGQSDIIDCLETQLRSNQEIQADRDQLKEDLDRQEIEYDRKIVDLQNHIENLELQMNELYSSIHETVKDFTRNIRPRTSSPKPNYDGSYMEFVSSNEEIDVLTLIKSIRHELDRRNKEIKKWRENTRTYAEQADMIDRLNEEVQALMVKQKDTISEKEKLKSLYEEQTDINRRKSEELNTFLEKLTKIEDHSSSLENELGKREELIDNLKKTLEKSKNERQFLANNFKTLESDFETKVTELHRTNRRVSDLEQQIKSTLLLCAEKDERIDEANSKMSMMKNLHSEQCAELQRNIDILQNSLKKCDEQREILERSVTAIREEVLSREDSLSKIRNEYEVQLEKKDETIRRLKRERDENINEMKDIESKILSYEKNIDLQVDEMERLKDRHQSELEIVKRKSNNKIEGLELEINKLRLKLHEIEDEAMRAKSEEYSAEVQELFKKVSFLEDCQGRLEQELKEAGEQLVAERDDSERLKDRIAEMEGIIISSKSEINSLKDHLKDKDESNEKLLNALREKEDRLKRTEENYLLKSNDLNKVKAEFTENGMKIERWENKLEEREKTIDHQKKIIRRLQDENRSLERECISMENDLKERQGELLRRAEEISQLEAGLRHHKENLQQRASQLEDGMRKAILDSEQKSKELSRLKNSLSKTELNSNNYVHELNETKRELEEKNMELNQLKLDFKKFNIAESKVQNELGRMNEREKDLLNQVEKLTKALDEVRKSSISLNEQLHENRKLQGDLNSKILDLEMENKKLKDEIKSKKLGLNKRNEETSQYSRKIESLERDLKLKESEIRRLEAELSEAQNSHANLHKDRDEALAKLKEVEQEINEIKDTYRKTNADQEEARLKQATQYRLRITQLEVDKEKLEQKFKTSQQSIKRLSKQIADRDELLDNVKQDLILKESEITRLQTQMSGFERSADESKILKRINAIGPDLETNSEKSLTDFAFEFRNNNNANRNEDRKKEYCSNCGKEKRPSHSCKHRVGCKCSTCTKKDKKEQKRDMGSIESLLPLSDIKQDSPITLIQHYDSDSSSRPKMASLEDSDSTCSEDVFARLSATRDKLTSKFKTQK
ncbi:DgyrCDS172 [Dimorphilus gyrociliatus]|uniref:DgyrCDS172 n=1 Tax=Dimorphilus gyrociliatus TaxID=2664684 RepID=A0A7I8V6D1_9ANNE|nr:DgyrCDS172 [Dimorphilus gyrociliatus]